MLYLILIMFSFNSFAVISPQMRECMSKLLDRTNFDKKQQDFYRQWRGGQGAVDKQYRSRIGQAKPGDTDKKHDKADNIDDAKRMSKTAAQYMPGIDRVRIERRALNPETPGVTTVDKGVMYRYVRFNHPVGYDNGKETYFMRVELTSSNEFHGHPMSVDRVKKAIGEAATHGLEPNVMRKPASR